MKNMKVSDLAKCALFTALIAVGAFIKIPIPMVPITLQTLFTMLAGLLLGGKLGALSVLVYVLLGLSGVPVFASGGGLGYVLKPSFGYFIGFFFGTYLTGTMAEKYENPTVLQLVKANLLGSAVVYFFGLTYMYLMVNFYLGSSITFVDALWKGMIIFLPGDLIKSTFTASVAKRLIPMIRGEKAEVR